MRREFVTRDEMVALDRWAIETIGIPSVVLMENAGRHCAERIIRRSPDPAHAPMTAIAVGRGNNGGDGFVVARHLWNAGYPVKIVLPHGPGHEAPGSDPALHAASLRALGLEMLTGQAGVDALAEAGVIVDALFGTGLRSAPREPYAGVIDAINARRESAYVLAVDIPSGLDCDTGVAPGPTVIADTTVTLQYAKRGFTLADGPAHTGEVIVVDITIPRSGPGRPIDE